MAPGAAEPVGAGGAVLSPGRGDALREVRAILDGLPAMIGYWDTDLRNRLANRAYVEYFGVEPTAIRGMHIREVLGEELFARNFPFMERALAGEEQLFDRTIIDTSGRARHTQASYIPDVVDGTVQGFFVLVTDITARREAEIALALADKELRRSNRDLQEFAAAASHDLRSPLVSIGGFARLLEQSYGDVLDENGRKFLGLIVSGVDRLDTLITDLLTFATAGAPTANETVDLGAVLTEVIASLEGVRAEVSGTVEVSGEPPTLQANRTQLVQLFQNLLTNGFKFHGPLPPVVRVHFSPLVAGEYAVQVSDNGIGIPAEQVEKVFGMFQRLHGRDQYSGTGIGLALCRRIVERHGGTIGVVPTDGAAGTTIRFTLRAGLAGPT